MSPSLALGDAMDDRIMNTKLIGNLLQSHSRLSQLADHGNICVGKFGFKHSFATYRPSGDTTPHLIGLIVNPFKIFYAIVFTVVIYMVDLIQSFRRFTYERKGDKSMNLDRGLTIVFRQGHLQIPVKRSCGSQNTISNAQSASRRDTFDTSQIRDRVIRVERNGTPDFVFKFDFGKIGISHLQKITPFVNRLGLMDCFRNLSACFYFITRQFFFVRRFPTASCA